MNLLTFLQRRSAAERKSENTVECRGMSLNYKMASIKVMVKHVMTITVNQVYSARVYWFSFFKSLLEWGPVYKVAVGPMVR